MSKTLRDMLDRVMKQRDKAIRERDWLKRELEKTIAQRDRLAAALKGRDE